MGTPEFAVGTLQRLLAEGMNVVGVVTQPDRPVGRHAVLTPPAVKVCAMEHGLPVLQPEKMRDEAFLEALRAWHADLFVVVAFRMLPEVVWSMPRLGTFNVHASLLPQYRGAAPINWALINGEQRSGVTTFFLDHEIDTGRTILQRAIEIPSEANVEWLYDRLMMLGADIAVETIDAIISDANGEKTLVTTPQPEGVFAPAPKIFKETCEIDWCRSAEEIHNFVRGLSPVPGAWGRLAEREVKVYASTVATAYGGTDGTVATAHGGADGTLAPGTLRVDGKRLLVATGDGWLEILEIQPIGKKRMAAADFINGLK